MKGRKNLEKAIVLGLMLSSIAAPVWAYEYTKPTDGSGTGLGISQDTYYNEDVYVHISSGERLSGFFGGTTVAYVTSNGAEINSENRNYDFIIINDIDGSEINSRENNALYAAGGSKITINADTVKIMAVGGSWDNTAISAKNAQSWHNGDNKINISGNTVEIIGDIDVSRGNNDSNNTNVINLTLDSAESYWIGNERTGFGTLNLKLSNDAQWIYGNDGIFNSKQITNLDLNYGIVNLQEDSIKNLIQNENISEYISNTYTNNKHDDVTIVNLTGNGGIFKADIDWITNLGAKEATNNSDYIFIENSVADSTQTLDFDTSKANLDKMNIGDNYDWFFKDL